MRKKQVWKKWIKWGRYLFLVLFFAFLVTDSLLPFRPEIPYSTLVLTAEDRPMMAFLSKDDKWRMYLEEEEISEEIRDAFLLKEDRWFYYHPGFNPISILRAGIQNLRDGRRSSGASTLTMQVVRLLEPRPRTYLSKLIELFRAVQLEWHYSKDEILQMYLNLVPYGGNVEGVKAASLLYFQRMPSQLSPARIATLAVVPNRPGSWKLEKGNRELKNARNRWLRNFAEDGWIDGETLESALNEEMDIDRKEQEPVAPHLAYRLFASESGPVIRSHIRYEVQRKCEELTRQYVQSLKYFRITNASVLIIDNESRKVVAYLGSADFNDKSSQGEVDGVRAVRSPGSTLKPFVYGWAIERGIITPKTILYDAPVTFAGYSPENYDLRFHGAVTSADALAHSLNIPAVSLLREFGVEEFIRKSGNAGFGQIHEDRDKLGLSMILGGCGVRLEELCNAYASLADGGEYRPLRYTRQDSGMLHFPLMSEEAAFLISEMLTGLNRPDLPHDWQSGKSVPRIAWKTGTSYGRRDGWSIGFNSRYAIGVWTGNFDNSGSPELNGADIATPLLFRLFMAIDNQSNMHWLNPPEGLSVRAICTETGQVPGEHCMNKGSDYFLPGISRHQYCDCRQELLTNSSGTELYCRSCAPPGAVKKIFRVYPAAMIRYFTSEQVPYAALPPHNPRCPRIIQEEGPRIIHPRDQASYLIEKGDDTKLALQAQVDAEVKEVYWYLNDRYLGSCAPSEPFLTTMPSGEAKISCTDDRGRTSHVRISVRRF